MGKFRTLFLSLIISLLCTTVSFASGWKQDSIGWWYQNEDGSIPVSAWQWIDGNSDGIAECYYFGVDGTLLTGTDTPDGYTVNEDGAWTINGIVQTKIIACDNNVVEIDKNSDEIYIEKINIHNEELELVRKVKINTITSIDEVDIYMENGILKGTYNIPENGVAGIFLNILNTLYYEDGSSKDFISKRWILEDKQTFNLINCQLKGDVESIDIIIRED